MAKVEIGIPLGIWLAVIELQDNRDTDRRHVAIDAVAQLTSREFQTTLNRLKASLKGDYDDDKKLVDDANSVAAACESIALLFTQGVADKEIVRRFTCLYLLDAHQLLKDLKYPAQYRANCSELVEIVNCPK